MISAIIYAAIGAGALGALAYLYWRVTRSGKLEAENDALRSTLDLAARARRIENVVDSLPPASLDDKLRQHTRD